MQDIIAALVHFFLFEPLQAELSERLAGARIPQDFARGLGIWTGMVQPEDVLVEAAPGCAQALGGARGLLAS
jgi:hypothetical protein